ncbi:MAG: hypothetical protein ACK5QH_00750 [Rubrivivax sp.]|jgi:hypothetical protein
MAIRYLKKHAALEGVVSAEEAEGLVQWLREHGTPHKPAAVHLGKCEHLHSAALQVLLALRPAISAPPADRWLAGVLGVGPTPTPTPASAA